MFERRPGLLFGLLPLPVGTNFLVGFAALHAQHFAPDAAGELFLPLPGGTLLVGDGVEFVVVVFHVGRKRLLAYDFGSGSQFGRARTRVADELFRGGSDGLARNDFERRFGLAEEILFDAPLEITAAQEVLHQPVFERMIRDDD